MAMSIKGIGANDKYYNGAPRFQAAQVGLGIPLFFGAQKNKITASKVNEQVAKNEYELTLLQWQSFLQQMYIRYSNTKEKINYYESNTLKQSNSIGQIASQQLDAGAINYLEWVMLINQSATIQSEYLDALKELHDYKTKIDYLISN
jgi:cobalt-zinc-cadmium resistance protein CzcA